MINNIPFLKSTGFLYFGLILFYLCYAGLLSSLILIFWNILRQRVVDHKRYTPFLTITSVTLFVIGTPIGIWLIVNLYQIDSVFYWFFVSFLISITLVVMSWIENRKNKRRHERDKRYLAFLKKKNEKENKQN